MLGRDFTTSAAWAEDARRADARKGLSGLFYSACEILWALFVLGAGMVLLKRVLAIIGALLGDTPPIGLG
jgi:hypothetical protein